ncbi:hypothetical protein [Armatimonas sp.]
MDEEAIDHDRLFEELLTTFFVETSPRLKAASQGACSPISQQA